MNKDFLTRLEFALVEDRIDDARSIVKEMLNAYDSGVLPWFHVNDRLPKEGEPVLYYFEPFRSVHDGRFVEMTEDGPCFASNRGGFSTGDVVYWLPVTPPLQDG